MRKIIIAAVVGLFFVSCATKTGDEITDEYYSEMVVSDANSAADIDDLTFQKEYDEHKGILNLDGAAEYTVVKGDTLSNIARKIYGDGKNAFYFPIIMLASSNVVKNPDLIKPGMKLVIPNLEKNLQDNTKHAQIKSFIIHIADIYKKANKYPKTQAGLRILAKSIKV